MSLITKRSWLIWAMAICIISGVMLPTTQSQENTAEKKAPNAKKKAEPKGRLPTYYGEVVSGEQKEKIYSIQAKYVADIKKLKDQLTALEDKRDEEVAGVLTADQKAKVAKLGEAAKAKRAETMKKKSDAAPKTDTPPAASTTAAPPATK